MEYHSTNDYIIKFRDGESALWKQKRMKKISRYKNKRERERREKSFNNERTKKLGKETGCSTIIHSPMQLAFTDSKKYRAEMQVKKYNVIQMSKVQLY